jgi:hypothetical protein
MSNNTVGFPCRICRKPTKTFGFTYGACDACTKQAIDQSAQKAGANGSK